jgi:16S rRNA processing protein RimM
MAGRADWRAERLHLLTPGAEAPRSFEVESARPHKDGLLVRLKGLSTRTEAEALRKAAVYVADEVLRSPPGEPIFLRQILGFELVDPAGAGLGEISGFSSNGPQDLLEVSRPGRPVALVPFVDAFLIDIDFDKKQVRMDLPPGLLNLEEE